MPREARAVKEAAREATRHIRHDEAVVEDEQAERRPEVVVLHHRPEMTLNLASRNLSAGCAVSMSIGQAVLSALASHPAAGQVGKTEWLIRMRVRIAAQGFSL